MNELWAHRATRGYLQVIVEMKLVMPKVIVSESEKETQKAFKRTEHCGENDFRCFSHMSFFQL